MANAKLFYALVILKHLQLEKPTVDWIPGIMSRRARRVLSSSVAYFPGRNYGIAH
jgi:hypothetical protein